MRPILTSLVGHLEAPIDRGLLLELPLFSLLSSPPFVFLCVLAVRISAPASNPAIYLTHIPQLRLCCAYTPVLHSTLCQFLYFTMWCQCLSQNSLSLSVNVKCWFAAFLSVLVPQGHCPSPPPTLFTAFCSVYWIQGFSWLLNTSRLSISSTHQPHSLPVPFSTARIPSVCHNP